MRYKLICMSCRVAGPKAFYFFVWPHVKKRTTGPIHLHRSTCNAQTPSHFSGYWPMSMPIYDWKENNNKSHICCILFYIWWCILTVNVSCLETGIAVKILVTLRSWLVENGDKTTRTCIMYTVYSIYVHVLYMYMYLPLTVGLPAFW